MTRPTANRRDPKSLLKLFIIGSIAILSVCLMSAALYFSATFLKKEAQRADTATDQLANFFDFQYRSITEEMWTGSYEAISLRVGSIAKQFGNASYSITLFDERKACVFATETEGCGNTPSGVMSLMDANRSAGARNRLVFNKTSSEYEYATPLYVGAVLKGYLFATVSDPYGFYRDQTVSLALRLFWPVILAILVVWAFWLWISNRLIGKPYFQSLVELQKKQALGDMAAQLAHDIHSPLATLMNVVRNSSGLPQNQAQLLKSAASRIQNIAEELLNKYKDRDEDRTGQVTFVSSVVNSIISEKVALLGNDAPTEIRTHFEDNSLVVGARIPETDLARILSNLLNNSIEATQGVPSPVIMVSAKCSNDRIIISVQDNGCGIPTPVISRILESGGSFGKTSGAGIGLQHAKTVLARVGGELLIESRLGVETTVSLDLPRLDPPTWCAQTLEVGSASQIVVLDDDESIQLLWQQKFPGLEMVYLRRAEDFKVDSLSASGSFFVLDYEICGSPITGLDLIERHGLGSRACLVTSYFDNQSIQRRVLATGAKLLPKFMISDVPIEGAESIRGRTKEPIDLVLVDDDLLVHDLWRDEARRKQLKLLAVSSMPELLKYQLPKAVPIFVDKNLAGGESGLDVVRTLYEFGFENLHLTTGEEPEQYKGLPYLRTVIGKDFPEPAVLVVST